MSLPVLYQDEHYVAIHKPPGLLVHRSPMDARETRFAVQELRNQLGQPVYPIHRLDKPTSGLLLFALHSEAAARVARQFAEHTLQKTYLAIVRGHAPAQLHIDYPVKARADKRDDKLAPRTTPQGITDLTTLARCEVAIANDRYTSSRYSLVELSPRTGRRHQLRYHMKHISHPIIGDPKYGKNVHNQIFRTHFQSQRLLLAAVSLRFEHPYRGQELQIDCPPDPAFLEVMTRLGWTASMLKTKR